MAKKKKTGQKSAQFLLRMQAVHDRCTKCGERGQIAITKTGPASNGWKSQKICRDCIGGFPLKADAKSARSKEQKTVTKIVNRSRRYSF